MPDSVWEEYHLDQEINDRGVGLDMELVRQAIQMDGRSRSELTQAMKELTSLDNPNSVQQMKQWLADNGVETDTLGKKAVAELLKTAPQQLQKVLTLRQQLAKSSVKKYQAMETAVCADGRARGMFQFYGANRTGRWAGRIIQMQNLPQNHLDDLAEARGLVRVGDFDALEILYEDVPDTLSQLIRTAFVPHENRKFIVADFSAFEARVIAWLAGEKWRQDVFAEIMHPEITKAMEAADAEPNADTPVPMPTADPEQFKTYQVPDEFMRVYKTLSTATEMMKNTWKRVLKNNQSYLSDPEKQKVLRFAMQRPALYLNELEACMEQILAETLEEAEKTA